jgi:nitroreductase
MDCDSYENLKMLCQKRKSVREFEDKKIPDEVIEKIIQISTTSPFVSNKKKWDVIAITDKKIIKECSEVVRNRIRIMEKKVRSDLVEDFKSYSRNFYFFENAPVIFILTFRISHGLSILLPEPEIIEWERDNFVKSISCAGMLVLLAAESLELGTCYMTGPLIAEKEIAEILKIKSGRNIGAIIPAGYKKSPSTPPVL